MQSSRAIRVGVISDTHGLLRPEAVEALQGCRLIIHAGDVGNLAVLEHLSALAPVCAVRGNNDTASWASLLPPVQLITVHGRRLLITHDLGEAPSGLTASGTHVVVFGHSHQPATYTRDGVLFFNPGSAGPRRFSLPVSVGTLQVSQSAITPTLHELRLGGPA